MDHCTKIAFAAAVPSVTSDQAMSFLDKLAASYGRPRELVTDRGTAFMSHVFDAYLAKHSIKHSPTSAYHPESNGMVERLNGTLVRSIRKLCDERPSSWASYLPHAVLAYNSAVHSVTGHSPFMMLFGLLDSPDDERFLDNYHRRVAASLIQQSRAVSRQEAHDVTANAPPLAPGDMVFVKAVVTSKLSPRWHGPARITQCPGMEVYEIEGVPGRLHRSRLRKVTDPTLFQAIGSLLGEGKM